MITGVNTVVDLRIPSKLLNDAEHWLSRAEEARTMGENMNDPSARHIMMRIAADYEWLAKCCIERRLSQGRGTNQ